MTDLVADFDTSPVRRETIFAAIELSRSAWLVALQLPSRGNISRHKLEAGDVAALFALFERARQRDGLEGDTCRVITCYEAGYDGFWLHRILEAAGVLSFVLDPSSLQVDRRGRRAKTDRLDVEAMLRTLITYCRGDRHVGRMVHVPTIEDEDRKRTHRERKRLISERVGHVNRIKALLATQGVYDVDVLGLYRERLVTLTTKAGDRLPARLRRELARELDRLTLVLDHIAAVEEDRHAMVSVASRQQHASGTEQAWQFKLSDLVRLKSIGPEIGTVLATEVFYRTFKNRREVASYVGLTPCPFKSGRVDHDQGIGKAGNTRARVIMIELAWLWVRHQPKSELATWFRQRVGGTKGRMRRIMIVALARKLLVALWRYVEQGVLPNGAVLKA